VPPGGQSCDLKSLELLSPALQDQDSLVRCAGVKALGEVQDDRSADLLLGLLSDPVPSVRQAAATALDTWVSLEPSMRCSSCSSILTRKTGPALGRRYAAWVGYPKPRKTRHSLKWLLETHGERPSGAKPPWIRYYRSSNTTPTSRAARRPKRWKALMIPAGSNLCSRRPMTRIPACAFRPFTLWVGRGSNGSQHFADSSARIRKCVSAWPRLRFWPVATILISLLTFSNSPAMPISKFAWLPSST